MKAKRIITNTIKSLILPVIVYVLFTIMSKGRFGSWGTFTAICRQMVYPILVAWAICNNQTMGVWDYTPGSVVLLSAIVGVNMTQMLGWGWPGMYLFIMLTAIACTMLTCTVFTFCRIPSIITSLGMLMLYESLGATLFGGTGIAIKDRSWTFLAKEPWIYIVLVGCFTVIYLINNYTKFGHDVRALGYGRSVSKNIGVNLIKTRYKSFLLNGIFIGIASIIEVSITGALKPMTGMNTINVGFSAILAVMVGEYLSRYCDLLIGTCLGSLSLKMLNAGMLAIGLKSETQQIGEGVFLILFLAVSHNQGVFEKIKDFFVSRFSAKKVAQNNS